MPDQIHNRKVLKKYRKDLRNHLTPAEAELWTHLKHSKIGQKFRRQHSVGSFILDFYCPQSKLCIELDGNYHFTADGMRYDERRTAFLEGLGIRVVRFENEDVFKKLPDVLNVISSHLA